MSNLQKWGTWTPEARAREAEEVAKAASGDFLKLVEGRNILRFLPPRVGQTSPFQMVFQHYVKKPGSKGTTTFACPRQMSKKFCPVCDYCDKLRKTGVPADRDAAFEMGAKLVVLANVINRAAPDNGPQVVRLTKSTYEQLKALYEDVDAGGDFTDPETGYDVIIERKGTGRDDTEYMVRPARRQSTLGNLDWIEAQPDLGHYAVPKTEDEINDLLQIRPGADATPVGGGTTIARTPAQSQPIRTAQDIADEEQDALQR